MRKKLIDLLLKEDVSFRKVDPTFCNTFGYKIQGFAVFCQHVLGTSKEDVLEKMLAIKKRQNKENKLYMKLPKKENLFFEVRNGNKKLQLNKTYKYRLLDLDKTNVKLTQFKTGSEILKDIYYEDYFEYDNTKGFEFSNNGSFSYSLKRNDKPIDWNFWKPYEKLILEL